MIALGLMLSLAVAQCDGDAAGLDWPQAARCPAPKVAQAAWALRDRLASIQSLSTQSPGPGNETWCTTLLLVSGEVERCTERGCALPDAGCDDEARAPRSEVLQTLEEASVVAVTVTLSHGVRVARVEGPEGTAWLFTSGTGATVLGGTCDAPVWLGTVTGFPSFAVACHWSAVLAGAKGLETSVLHVVDLRRAGLVDLARFARVLGVRKVDLTRRVAPPGPPPPRRPTFRVDQAAIVAPDGRWCFGVKGWANC
jgi:hypothetical protein